MSSIIRETNAVAGKRTKFSLRRLLSGKHWAWKVTGGIFLLCLLFSPPRADLLWSRLMEEVADMRGQGTAVADDCWDPLDLKIAHPFANCANQYDEDENWAKRTFRITPVLAAHLLHLGKPGYFIIQILAGLIQIRLLLGWFQTLTGSRLKACLLSMMLTFTYYGQAAFFDTIGWGDPVGYCLLTLAVSTRRPWLCGVAVFLAGFTDERALPATGFAILTHYIAQRPEPPVPLARDLGQSLARLFLSPFTIAVFVSWGAYFASRGALSVAMDYKQPYGIMGWPLILRFATLHHFQPSVFFTLKLLIFPLIALFARRLSRWPLEIWLAACGVTVTVFLAFAVYDHVRSLAYLGPACLFALQFALREPRSWFSNKRILALLAAGNLLFPTVLWVLDIDDSTKEHRLQIQRPLPAEIVWVIERWIK